MLNAAASPPPIGNTTTFVALVRSLDMTELKALMGCESCGAAVHSSMADLHHRWHMGQREAG